MRSDECPSGTGSIIRPLYTQLLREKDFSDRSLELPRNAVSRIGDEWIRHELYVRVIVPTLVRGSKDTAGVPQLGEVFREAEGPRSADHIFRGKSEGEDHDYVLGHCGASSKI